MGVRKKVAGILIVCVSFLILLVVLGSGNLIHGDEMIFTMLNPSQGNTTVLDSFFIHFSSWGPGNFGFGIYILIILFILLAILSIKQPSLRHLIILMTIGLVIYFGIDVTLKLLIMRGRPFLNSELFSSAIDLFSNPSATFNTYSFPSTHTGVTFAILTPIIVINKNYIIKCSALFYGGLIGYSRIFIGVHFPSDVFMGGLIAILISLVLYSFLKNKINPKRDHAIERVVDLLEQDYLELEGVSDKRVSNVSELDTKTKLYTVLFIIIIVLMAIIYIYHFTINDSLLPRIVLEWVIIPLRNVGVWGFLIFFGLMVIQSLVAPIPSEMVLLASGLIWGLLGGIVVGFFGSLITAFIGYYISYKGGRPIANVLLGPNAVKTMGHYTTEYGGIFIFTMRAIPLITYDLFTMVSGFTQMEFKRYAISTTLGTIPRVIFYSWAGTLLAGDVNTLIAMLQTDPSGAWTYFQTSAYKLEFNIWLTVIVVIIAIGFLIFYLSVVPTMKKRYKNKELGGNYL